MHGTRKCYFDENIVREFHCYFSFNLNAMYKLYVSNVIQAVKLYTFTFPEAIFRNHSKSFEFVYVFPY